MSHDNPLTSSNRPASPIPSDTLVHTHTSSPPVPATVDSHTSPLSRTIGKKHIRINPPPPPTSLTSATTSSTQPARFRRPRDHVNPLCHYFQLPVQLPVDWVQQEFADPHLPFHVDIGCGYGKFCVSLASLCPSVNVIGLEIRKTIAEHANEKKPKELTNLLFVGANANVDMTRILSDIDSVSHCGVNCVTIQFPDPCFKKKHLKRRVVTKELVETLQENMNEVDGCVFLQSDVIQVMDDMVERFVGDGRFNVSESASALSGAYGINKASVREAIAPPPLDSPHSRYTMPNPFPVRTDREENVMSRGDPVYRLLLTPNTGSHLKHDGEWRVSEVTGDVSQVSGETTDVSELRQVMGDVSDDERDE